MRSICIRLFPNIPEPSARCYELEHPHLRCGRHLLTGLFLRAGQEDVRRTSRIHQQRLLEREIATQI